MVEHAAVNRGVAGSSPARGVLRNSEVAVMIQGSVVKRLRHRPFTAVTRVRFPSESLTANFIVEISCGSFLQELPICQLIEVLYGDIAKR